MRASWLIFLAICWLFILHETSPAQVATDGTVGAERVLSGPDYAIDSALGTQAGSNLFHSFRQFSIGTGGSATFDGPGSIENIISRVTGGDISSIDGLLASTIPGASLFLLNPAGVVFGPNASLDLTGSFHVSSADELRLEDGTRFSAIDPDASGFSVAEPAAFGFLGSDPASVSIAGSQLSVDEGETLSVVGGDVDIAGGSLAVDAGQLNVLAANGPANAMVAMGDLTGAADGSIAVRDSSALVATGNGGGSIRIEGGQFVVDGNAAVVSTNTGSVDGDISVDIDVQTAKVSNDSLIATDTTAEGDGGAIDLKAETIQIAEGARVGSNSGASGDGGDLRIAGDKVAFVSGSSAVSLASASGDGGDVSVVADELALNGGDIVTGTGDTASGDGGSVEINVGSLDFRAAGADTSLIVAGSFGSGAAGDIDIRGGHVLADGGGQLSGASIQSLSEGEGSRGGQIRLIVDSLELVDGGLIIGDSSGGSVVSPGVEVAAETIQIDRNGGPITGISVDVDGQANSTPGTIVIRADDIDIQNGGQIDSVTGSANDSGNIEITADSLSLGGQDSAPFTRISSSSVLGATGDAGRITIVADTIELSGNAEIASATLDEGDAGVIDITANVSLRLQDFGRINTSTFLSATGDAGTISVRSDQILIDASEGNPRFLTGASSAVESGGVGAAGAVTIIADQLVLRGEAADITSSNDGEGLAGTIDIALTDSLTLDGGADIATRSASAGGGRVTIGTGASIVVTGPDSEISTTVADDAGDAGDITIETPLLALGNADILARADGGRGGDIQINAESLLLSPEALISAEAGVAGIDGTVAVSAPEVDLTGGLAGLDGQFLDISSLLRERCAVKHDTGSSSFTLGTAGSLPTDLDAPQLSLLETGTHRTSSSIGIQRTIEVIPCPKTSP